jgi:hypothetical protein
MQKTFPIQNDAACLYKWAWSTVFLSRGTTASCHRGYHWRLNEDNFMDFHNHPGKLSDREKMANGDWPSNGCEYCRDVEKAGGVSDRVGFVNNSIELLPPEMKDLQVRAYEYDNIPLSVSPTLLEVYFNNVCNQSCVYCTPGFSSQIEQEVRKYGPTDFNKDYSNWRPDTKYELYKEKFWEWMEKHSQSLQILQVLGGEPLYQKEFEQCLDFFDKNPRPNLIYRTFSNLKHDPTKFKEKIQRVQNLIDQGKLKRMEFVCSIDCWGPEIEYVRDGLILEDWENNINTLVDTPGVSINIHATLTALTLPTLYQLIEKTVSWQRPDKYVGINWNTVVSPTPFNPYHFGEHLAPFIDTAIETLQKFPDFTESSNLQKHLHGIKQQLISTTVNKAEVANLVGFLDEIDTRRNRNWRKVFPQIEQIVNTINTGEL